MINKKDSGATVLHLPLSEKTKPVDGLMTDYCSNIHFFEYLGSSKSTEQITNKLINSNHFEKIKKSLYIGLRKTREHQCPRTSRLSNIPFGEPHKNIAKFGGVEEGKSKMINKWVFRYPDFYSLWSAYETEAFKKNIMSTFSDKR